MKRFCVSILTLVILLSCILPCSFAKDDSGKIDFYKAFSKSDVNIDMIGNKIYNWSIYLPSDAVVDKNPKATSFNMSTNSFKSNIFVNVYKNKRNFTLEDLYSSLSIPASSEYSNGYKCGSKILTDNNNQKYISISTIIPEFSDYGNAQADDEKGLYKEERYYLNDDHNYIYKVSVYMDLQYFKQHQSLFYKLLDSFRTSFDPEDQNIKDLSNIATSYRYYENKIYGWKIELAPYWKSQSQLASTEVIFKPLYSYDEIGSETDSPSLEESEDADAEDTAPSDNNTDADSQETATIKDVPFSDNSKSEKVTDSMIVSFVSSVPSDETLTKWAEKEFGNIRMYSNKALLSEYISPEDFNTSETKRLFVAKTSRTSKDSFIEGTMLVQCNGYRYKVFLKMSSTRFDQGTGRDDFYRMLRSFNVTDIRSKYIKEVAPLADASIAKKKKVIALNCFDFNIPLNNNWVEKFDIYDGLLDDEYSYDDDEADFSIEDTSNEEINLINIDSGVTLNIYAQITNQTENEWTDDFKKSASSSEDPTLNNVYFSGAFDNFKVFKTAEEYDFRKMEELSSNDERKIYSYSSLNNIYTYSIFSGNETYSLEFTIPLMNCSEGTKKVIDNLWKNLTIGNIKLSEKIKSWAPVQSVK